MTSEHDKTAMDTIQHAISALLSASKANHKEAEQYPQGSAKRYRIINSNKGLMDAVKILNEQYVAIKYKKEA